jgi:hypothetical protein
MQMRGGTLRPERSEREFGRSKKSCEKVVGDIFFVIIVSLRGILAVIIYVIEGS